MEDKRLKQVPYTYIDRRTIDTLAEARVHHIGKKGWFDRGTNHREERSGNCGIARDLDTEYAWTIEIASLKELLNFQKEFGEDLIISPTSDDGEDSIAEYRLEIYDTYRE